MNAPGSTCPIACLFACSPVLALLCSGLLEAEYVKERRACAGMVCKAACRCSRHGAGESAAEVPACKPSSAASRSKADVQSSQEHQSSPSKTWDLPETETEKNSTFSSEIVMYNADKFGSCRPQRRMAAGLPASEAGAPQPPSTRQHKDARSARRAHRCQAPNQLDRLAARRPKALLLQRRHQDYRGLLSRGIRHLHPQLDPFLFLRQHC